jgi:signal transduction histidine kinase
MAAYATPAPLRFVVPWQSGPAWSPSPSPPGERGRALPAVGELDRRRLARQLHDSVIQPVLAAGLAIDWCMGEVPAGSPVHEQLTAAKRLACGALRELRSSLQELAEPDEDEDEDLPGMLARLFDTHAPPRLRVSLHVRGTPQPLPLATRRWLYRFAAECLFNSAIHADASRAAVRLRYANSTVALTVADDGHGKPQKLRRIIAGEVPGTGSGYHFGLTDIAATAREMNWTLRVRRAALGGIAMEVRLPTRPVPDIAGDTGD